MTNNNNRRNINSKNNNNNNNNNSNNQNKSLSLSSLLNGLGGWNHGSLFCINDNIDLEKPPGMTSYDIQIGGRNNNNNNNNDIHSPSRVFWNLITLQSFLYSPNLTWFVLACMVWYFVPYRIFDENNNTNNDNTIPITYTQHFIERLWVNHIMVFGYAGFWHITLYYFHWAKRPYAPKISYNYPWPKVIHNIFYCWLGVLQWTVTEIAFFYAYQTNRIYYNTSDPAIIIGGSSTTIFTTHPKLVLTTILACWLVPPYRDLQFYFAHRLIHIKCLYKYIHFVHHRNTDIEPFSGLAMHPMEHLYYYSCYAPCLITITTIGAATSFYLHPFVLFWMEFHTLLAPFASHSGFEDHFSADLHHYLHHRYYECNYGAGIPFDVWFGTYRDQLKPQHCTNVLKTPIIDPKATLWNTSTTSNSTQQQSSSSSLSSKLSLPENTFYVVSCIGISTIILWFGTIHQDNIFTDLFAFPNTTNTSSTMYKLSPWISAILVSTIPCWMAVLCYQYNNNNNNKKNVSMLSPFDKDPFGKQVLHIGLGLILGVFPVTYLLYLLLEPNHAQQE